MCIRDNYKKLSPSKELVDARNVLIASKQWNDESKDTNLADDDSQSVIINGIPFPIWKMKDCIYNDSKPTRAPVRNNNISIQWVELCEDAANPDSGGQNSSSENAPSSNPPAPVDSTMHDLQARVKTLTTECARERTKNATKDEEVRF